MYQDPRYKARYTKNPPSEFWILDNGVAEGLAAPNAVLLGLTQHVEQFDEIVAPDVMGKTDDTLIAAGNFCLEFDKTWPGSSGPNIAGVVQGQGVQEWIKCINAYMSWPVFHRVTTLMFPRCMNSEASPRTRYHFLQGMFNSSWWAEMLRDNKWPAVHCLGASSWVREVVALSELPIRGMDTCLPVALGLEGVSVKRGIYIKRQPDYFGIKSVDQALLEVIDDNCRIYREWAGDDS